MKRRLAAGETDSRDIRGGARFADYASQEIDRKEFCVMAVEVVVSAKSVTAMEIADIRQLHTQTLWSIIAIERSLCLHLCATSVSSVSLWLIKHRDTETQRVNSQHSPAPEDRGRHADRTRSSVVPIWKATQD